MIRHCCGMIACLALLGLGGCQLVAPKADAPAPKVGATTGAGAGLSGGGGWLTVDKADILAPRRGGALASDVDDAIAHYDRVLDLQAAPELRAEAMRRAAYLRIRRFAEAESGEESDLHAALRLYERLLNEMPEAAGNDLARYQWARALDLLGRRVDAARTLVALTERHPGSASYADAAFRAGELFYSEERLAEAEDAYQRLLGHVAEGDSLRQIAAYKLGWTRLRAGRHAQAATVFRELLERLLPESGCAGGCAASVLDEGLDGPDREMAQDALRGFSRTAMALGGAEALDSQPIAADHGPLYYWAIAEALLERRRYSDAADAFEAFVQRFPQHELAPRFHLRVVEAYEAGGFAALASAARATFVSRYHPDTDYWQVGEPPEWLEPTLIKQLELLATNQHARAQSLVDSSAAGEGERAHRLAARWYGKWLKLLAEGPERSAVRMRYADALLGAGAPEAAIREFSRVAYDTPEAAEASAAALALVQTRFRVAREASEAAREAKRREAIAAARRLAERFPGHPERARVLLRAAEESLALEAYEQAIDAAGAVLAEAAPATALWRAAMHVRADSHFALEAFEPAEAAYQELLGRMPPLDAQRLAVTEQLGAVIYRQGQRARGKGDFRQAASHFLRIGDRVPEAPQRPGADYDAASALVKAGDWEQAAARFEAFVGRYPGHTLVPDADKWLATAYDELGLPHKTAEAYRRIAERRSEPTEVRREAVWQAATRFDEVGARRRAAEDYRAYLQRFGGPMDRAQRARLRLAELAGEEEALDWLHAVRRAHREAGAAASAYSELAAAQAALRLGTALAERAASVRLTYPLRASLQRRQLPTREAIEYLRAARASGFDELVTEAAFGLGSVHAGLASDLRDSQRPPGLDDFERDAYELMLEDEAFPFEERAIAEHKRNLEYLRDGVWDQWILASARALADWVPGRYARRERQEELYAEID